jgi:hypothetical protein
MGDKHSEGSRKKLFCYKRTKSKEQCECEAQGGNYRVNCGCSWNDFREGHHVLPIAVVSLAISEYISLDESNEDIVNNTKWCVNKSPNMLGLPTWPNYLAHYIKFRGAKRQLLKQPQLKDAASIPAPNCSDHPVHTYDHHKYNAYVQKKLFDIIKNVKESKKKHDKPSAKLRDHFVSQSETVKSDLKEWASTRAGGTHQAWINGMEKSKEGKKSDWYKPFSMAPTGEETEMAFPLSSRSDEIWGKIVKMAEGIWVKR